ncbi:VTC domain-containing protein [Nocardioides sp. NPDC126508]
MQKEFDDRKPETGQRTLRDIAYAVAPISLEEMNTEAALMRRVDQKYLVTAATFRRLMSTATELLGDDLRVLDIDGDRVMGYESVYYDSPDLVGFRAHVQGRRRRYKVRTRSYVETGVSFVEVKYKAGLDVTSKMRTAYPDAPAPGLDDLSDLPDHGVAFAGQVIADAYALDLADRMDPVLRTTNRRATFLIGPHGPMAGGRMTVDVALEFDDGDSRSRMRSDLLLIETKSAGSSLVIDDLLRRLGERPVSMSKYCVGVSLLRPGVSGNKWRRITRTYFEAA